MNCHGCKWLDQMRRAPQGEGYCAKVVESASYTKGDRVRYADKERCELYEAGDFITRHITHNTTRAIDRTKNARKTHENARVRMKGE